MQPSNRIDIFHFSSPREYLGEVLTARRKKSPALGLRSFARKAGFSSPSTLSMIINGKRKLTPAVVEKLAAALALTGRRKQYLHALGKLDSAKNAQERTQIQDLLFQLRNTADRNVLEVQQYRFLSTWYYPVIYLMIDQPGFVEDPEWIASRLKPSVTTADAVKALADLVALGMLKRSEGKLTAGSSNLATADDDVRNLCVHKYHAQMIDLAKKALDLPTTEREINGLTVAVPAGKMLEVKDMIRAFRRELNEHLSQFQEPGEIHQLNIQLFPLTQNTAETRADRAQKDETKENSK